MIPTNGCRFFSAALAMAALIFQCAHLQGATVTLKPEASVKGCQVYLAEVALIVETDVKLADRLKSVDLGYTPNPGYTRYITREQIQARLRTQGIDMDKVTLGGPSGVLVSTKSVMISGRELTAMGTRFLESRVAGLEGERTIQCPRSPADILVPVGSGLSTFDIKWRMNPGARGPTAVDIKVLVDGHLFTTVPLQFEISVFEKVLMASRKIKSGEPFTGTNTALVRVETTRQHGHPARGIEEMRLLLAKRDIPAGQIVRIEDGLEQILVSRGRPVSVTVKKGALLVKGKGIARQNGHLNDTVVVLNEDSGRAFKAVVTGLNMVEVRL